MTNIDVAFVRQIVGVQGAQQRRFAAAGMAVQHHAFTLANVQRGAVQDRQAHAVLLVEYKGLTDIFYADHGGLLILQYR